MRTSKIKANEYSPTENDTLIMDTNILIKILYPVNYKNNFQAYEEIYSKAIESKSKMLISSIQISEFINTCIRLQFNLYRDGQDMDFKKDYRSTEDYRNNMKAILEIIEHDILGNFTLIDDNITSMKQEALFIYGFSYDFNDAFLVELARINNAQLITDDMDFANYSSKINIVTANSRLLMFS